MNLWKDMNPSRIAPQDFIAVIEISKGSKNKYELDKESGALILDRVLYTSTHYPANYGFIPLTYADDKDPLDVLVLCSEQIRDPTYNSYQDVGELPPHIVQEIAHFFNVYKQLEHKETTVMEIFGKARALDIIKEAIELYREKFTQQ